MRSTRSGSLAGDRRAASDVASVYDTPKRTGSHSPCNASVASTFALDMPKEFHDAAATHKFAARLHCTTSINGAIWTAEGDAVRTRHPASGELLMSAPHVYSKQGVLVQTVLAVSKKYVWAGLDDGYIVVIDESTQRPVAEFRQHSGAVLTMVQDTERTQSVFTGGHDWKIYEWGCTPDSEGRITLQRMFYSHSNSVRCLSVAVEGYLVSGSSDSSVRIWELETNDPRGSEPDQSEPFAKYDAHKGAVRSVVAQQHPKDCLIWSGDEGGTLCLWGLGETRRQRTVSQSKGCIKARPLRTVSQHKGAIPSMIVYEDQVWSCGQDGHVVCWGAEWAGGAAPPDVWIIRSLATKGRLLGLQLCGRYTVQKLWSLALDHHSKSDGTIVAWNIEVPQAEHPTTVVPNGGGYMELERTIKRLQSQNEANATSNTELTGCREKIVQLEETIRVLQEERRPVSVPRGRDNDEVQRENIALQNEIMRLKDDLRFAGTPATPPPPPPPSRSAEDETMIAELREQQAHLRDQVARFRAEGIDLRRERDDARDAHNETVSTDMQRVLDKMEELRSENEWLQANARELIEQKSRTCDLLRIDIARISNELARAEDLAGAAEDADCQVGELESSLFERDEEISRLTRHNKNLQSDLAKALREAESKPHLSVDALEDAVTHQSATVETLRSDNTGLANSLEESRSEVRAQAKVVRSLNEILNERNKSIDLLKDVAEERAQQIDVLEEEVRAMQAQTQRSLHDASPFHDGTLAQDRVERLQDELAEKRSHIDRLHLELDSVYADKDRLDKLEVENTELDADLRSCQGEITTLRDGVDKGRGALEECASLRARVAEADEDMRKVVAALDANPVASEAKRRIEDLLEENAVLLVDNKTLAEQQELLRSHVEQLEDSKTRAADVKSVHENYESLEEEKEALLLQVATLQERCAGLEASTVGQMSGEEYDRLEQRARELAMTVTLQKEAAEQCATSTDVLLDLLTAYEEELAELHADLEQHTPHTPTDNDSTVVERLLRESREKGATAATLQIRLTAANKELAQKTAKCDELRESSADLQKRVVMLEKHLGESSGVYDRGYLEGLSALCERKNGVVAGLLDEVHRRDTLLSDAHEFMQRRSAALAAARTLNSLHPQEATHDLNELREESRALRVQLRKSQIKESKTHHEPQGDGTMGDKIDKLVAELEKREHMMCQRDALIHSLQNKLATTEFDKPMENVVSGLQVEVRQGQRSLRIKERHLGYAQRRCEQLVALVNHDVRDGAGAAAREEDLLKALGEAEERLKEQDVMLVNIQHAQEIAANSLAKVTTEHEALRLSSEGEQRRRHEAEHDMVSLTDTLKAAQLNIDGLRQQLEDQEEQTGSDTGGTTLSQIKDENKELVERLNQQIDTTNAMTSVVQTLQEEQDLLHLALEEAQQDNNPQRSNDQVDILSERLCRELQADLTEKEEALNAMQDTLYALQADKATLQEALEATHNPATTTTTTTSTSSSSSLQTENTRLKSELSTLLKAAQEVDDCTANPTITKLETQCAEQDLLIEDMKEETGATWLALSDALEGRTDETPETLIAMAETARDMLEQNDRKEEDAAEVATALEQMKSEVRYVWDELSKLIQDHGDEDMKEYSSLADLANATADIAEEVTTVLSRALNEGEGRSLLDLARLSSSALLQDPKRDDMIESVRILAHTAGVKCSLKRATPDELIPVLDSCGGALLNLREEHNDLCTSTHAVEESLLREKERRRSMLEEVQTLKMQAEDTVRCVEGLRVVADSRLGVILEWALGLAERFPKLADSTERVGASVAEVQDTITLLAGKVGCGERKVKKGRDDAGRRGEEEALHSPGSSSPRAFRSIRTISPSRASTASTPIHLPQPKRKKEPTRVVKRREKVDTMAPTLKKTPKRRRT